MTYKKFKEESAKTEIGKFISVHGFIFPTEEDRQRVLDNCAKDLEILLKR